MKINPTVGKKIKYEWFVITGRIYKGGVVGFISQMITILFNVFIHTRAHERTHARTPTRNQQEKKRGWQEFHI